MLSRYDYPRPMTITDMRKLKMKNVGLRKAIIFLNTHMDTYFWFPDYLHLCGDLFALIMMWVSEIFFYF